MEACLLRQDPPQQNGLEQEGTADSFTTTTITCMRGAVILNHPMLSLTVIILGHNHRAPQDPAPRSVSCH